MDVAESRDALVVLAVVGVDLCPDATWLLPIQVSRDELLQVSPLLKYLIHVKLQDGGEVVSSKGDLFIAICMQLLMFIFYSES